MDFNKVQPIYVQLIEDFKIKIINGTYSPGDKLPSIRDYAQDKLVNPNTAQKAFSEIENQGLIFPKRGVGYFVIEDEEKLNELKYSYLEEKVQDFINKLTLMKFSREEIIDKVKENL